MPVSRKRKAKTTRRTRRQVRDRLDPNGSFDARRHTPPIRRLVRIRPTWHKVAGAVELTLGVVLMIVNWFAPALLPGGHSELYFLTGVGVAVGSP